MSSVALDYCVTYEVSPPAWQVPRCGYLDAAEGDGVSADLLAAHPPAAPDAAPAPATVGLSGHIEGDADAFLQNLESLAKPGQPLVVPCDRLIRIDFFCRRFGAQLGGSPAGRKSAKCISRTCTAWLPCFSMWSASMSMPG